MCTLAATGLILAGSCFAIQATRGARRLPRANSRPSLWLPARVVDLGRTSLRQQWHVPFKIHNRGARRLVINAVDAECGCQTALSDTIVVAPGSSALVTVPLDTRFVEGAVETTVRFTTSDPDHPRFDLTARAWGDGTAPVSRPDGNGTHMTSVLIHSP